MIECHMHNAQLDVWILQSKVNRDFVSHLLMSNMNHNQFEPETKAEDGQHSTGTRPSTFVETID